MKKLIEKLFTTYYKDVYNYLYSLSRNSALSEDMAQEVFLEVVKSVHKYRGESDIRTWLFSIARHKWFRYLRKKNISPEYEALSEFIPSGERPLEEKVYDESIVKRIYSLIDEENERTKKVLTMRLDGYSFYEIAQSVSVTESSARVIYFRAKNKIKEILIKEGYENE